MLEVRRGCF